MGKKKTQSGLGKALMRDRFGSQNRRTNDSFLHTSELNDGYEWGRLNLQSVTEQSTLDDFLATAELAGTEFEAERMNVTLVNPEKHTGLLTREEEIKVKETQDAHRQLLSVPRRPSWDENTTKEELDLKERDSFLEWRRKLAELQDVEGLVLTPFERNLDFWRQLWRVIERSDVVVQIVDSRNPLLFYCEDVDNYVREIDPNKQVLLLVNKADFLSQKQREHWAAYLASVGMRAVFWSAAEETERNKLRDEAEAAENERDDDDSHDDSDDEWTDDSDDDDDESIDEDDEHTEKKDSPEKSKDNSTTELEERLQAASLDNKATSNSSDSDNVASTSDAPNVDNSESVCDSREDNDKIVNSADIVTGEQLVDIFKSTFKGQTYQDGVTTIGLVGYPNVGKSSTINALLQTKKVPVSATPGRTKHFQTLFMEPTLVLCDCPGLVMPTFVSTKAEMVVSGILPIDQMRDYVPPVSLVCAHMPRQLLELTYGIMLPQPRVDDGEDPHRLPTAHELLAAYACMRGYMTHKGIPDYQRAARLLLKDYMNGKLLYCHPPPTVPVEEFRPTPLMPKVVKVKAETSYTQPKAQQKKVVSYTSAMDKDFFAKQESRIGSKGVQGGIDYTRTDGLTHQSKKQKPQADKPWKKHNNKGKKEKLRRLNRHLDVHDIQ